MSIKINIISKLSIAILFLTLCSKSSFSATFSSNSDYINLFIGTNGMGHTFPGACVPFGAVQLSPDTDTIPHSINGVYQKDAYKYCSGYQYSDKTIVGFSHTHFSGTGHSDLGDILIMPTAGKLQLNPGTAENPDSGYRSRFSHKKEKARPGYYEVLLEDYGIKAQLTTTERVGVHKYSYGENHEQRIILDLQHSIYNYEEKTLWANLRVENDTLLTGYRITNGWARTNYTYFAIALSKPILNYGYAEKKKVLYNGFWRKFKLNENFPEIGGRKIVAYFEFDPSSSSELVLKVGMSAVSTEGALKNLYAETDGLDFEQIAHNAKEKWDEELSRFEARGNKDQLTMFYTSLYHTMINPSIYMDVDRQYRGIDHNIHTENEFTNYTVFSLWDTYRALHPFFNIFFPQRNSDMIKSMLKHYEQSVHKALPVWSHMGNENWCMIGYHAASVLSDACVKGGVPFDYQEGLRAAQSSSTLLYYDNIKDYIDLGYVPFDKNRNSASITLEYAYDDWCIYSLAQKLKKTSVAEIYKKRALNYINTYDSFGFAHPRFSNGKWKQNFNLLNTHDEGFIEGNAWNYSFYVPHDINGLINIMGGEKRFLNRLDSLFLMSLPSEFYADTEDITSEGVFGGYVHGNEPSQHIPYLYAWTSEPWKSQFRIREIMNKMYKNNINGLCGNDDSGQMSAWYIFSAMGFYPVCPGTDQYVLGAPYLPYLRMKLGNGNVLEIKAPGISDKNRYVKSVTVNGKKSDKLYLTHDEILKGGEIVFFMSSTPNKKRGLSANTKPYSLTNLKEY